MFVRKDCDLSVWCMCRNYSTMKTKKECLCCQEVEAVCDFNLQGIFVPSQAIILSELTHNFMISNPIAFVTRRVFRTPAISKMELFAKVANVFKLSDLVAKCSILDFAGFLDWPLGI